MKAAPAARVLAVVVAYLPEPIRFRALLNTLLCQVDTVLVVDNTPATHLDAERVVMEMPEHGTALRLVRCGENMGIAAALNEGIDAARIEGYELVLLNDQDSLPAEDMVERLLATLDALTAEGARVGSVSPAYVDEVTGDWFGFQVMRPGKWFYSVVAAPLADPWIEVLTSITSGTLVPTQVFDVVGVMREDYFIDDVDVEWCLRARARGYQLFGTVRAVMRHRLGEDSFPLWFLRWRGFSSYRPLRLYYRFRNFIAVCGEDHAPLAWKVRASWYWLGNIYAYLLFSPNRLANARYIAHGLYDGFRGRMGRYDG
ncbi:MAG: glycosyltransferase family 2 protein [Luteimonas sp.]